MPVEVSGFADGGFLKSLFEKAVESSAGGCHTPSFGTGAGDRNRLRDFLINLSRPETGLDGWGRGSSGSVPLQLLALGG